MKRKKRQEVIIGTGTSDEFFARSLTRARRLDRGEPLVEEIRITFEDPADLLRLLTEQRVRVLNAVRRQPSGVSDLAKLLHRDRSAVDRDVKVLAEFGLVRTHQQINPGHGRKKVVEPLAARFELTATI